MYAGRNAVEQDDQQAYEWHKKPAKQGYVKARFNLGLLYMHGLGVEQD